jgi:hypothetical protein
MKILPRTEGQEKKDRKIAETNQKNRETLQEKQKIQNEKAGIKQRELFQQLIKEKEKQQEFLRAFKENGYQQHQSESNSSSSSSSSSSSMHSSEIGYVSVDDYDDVVSIETMIKVYDTYVTTLPPYQQERKNSLPKLPLTHLLLVKPPPSTHNLFSSPVNSVFFPFTLDPQLKNQMYISVLKHLSFSFFDSSTSPYQPTHFHSQPTHHPLHKM